MSITVEPVVLGLPEDFDLTEQQAQELHIDDVIADASLELGIFDTTTRLVQARNAAVEIENWSTARVLHLLVLLTQMGLSDDRRAPFGFHTAGHLADGRPFREPLPEDLTEAHIAALIAILNVVETSVLRARIADVLWHRVRRRDPNHAREAVKAYISVAEVTFDPGNWTVSEQHFGRAYRLASQLGAASPEFASVLATAWSFLDRLDGKDPLFYTHRLVSRIMDSLTPAQAEPLFGRVQAIAEESARRHDFERARRYYDCAIALAKRLQQPLVAKSLRLVSAETHVAQALAAPTETQRAMHLRDARDTLLDAGASRERRAEVAQLLEEAQRAMVSEMAAIPVEYSSGSLPEHVRNLLHGTDPIEGLWTLAGIPVLMTKAGIRHSAEDAMGKFHFHYGFGRRHITSDGREQGQTPGSLGARDAEREEAVLGAMHDHAKQARLHAVIGAIEPGRRALELRHSYTISEIYEAIQERPFVPNGHHLLWAKGIHAGLAGEYDVAVHLLAPQLEHALREVLRRHGEVVYKTRDGVQTLFSLPDVLDHPAAQGIFGDDHVFALESSLTERIGANVRNDVAHGIMDDGSSNSYDAAFVWWLALRMLRFYGPDALSGTTGPESGGASRNGDSPTTHRA